MNSSITPKASSSTCIRNSYHVFLSFRGEDTRKIFTDHLYTALVAYGLQVFRDDEELERGGDIATALSRAIEESKIFIIIFSKNYANSRWCLNELVKIMEQKVERESIVLPVFYHVNPSDVRKQSGCYKEAFSKHEADANQEKDRIENWRSALRKAADLSGYPVDNQYESKVIEEIIKEILPKLNSKLLYVGKNIVGMDYHLEELRALLSIKLNDIRMIGICGIGGIGKTTIAKALYNEILYEFDCSSFLADVREKSKDDVGLLKLQQQLLDDTLVGKYHKRISSIHEGINVIRDKLCLKKVLVILDDVDSPKQLENLAGECEWFGSGSRIIITTRRKNLLAIEGANQLYEPKLLNYEEAIKLLSLYAFKQNAPREDYENVSNSMVEYAKGLPLALKILGSILSSKTIHAWESELCRLENEPNVDIYNVLKISYNGLSHLQKRVFLDIACFFKGKDRDFVSRILDHAESEILNLLEMSLITIRDKKIYMHDLIQQMGWKIVYEECPDEPGERSRLWAIDEVSSVLSRNAGTKSIQGLFLDMSTPKEISFTTEAFQMMNRLRLLKVHQAAKDDHMEKIHQVLSPVYLFEDFKFPSFELRYLHWDAYSLESLPSNFDPMNLVELNLQCSNIKQLWKGDKLATKLKVINLNHSRHLIKLPNFSMMPNLEILTLEGCRSLGSLPRDIDNLKCLQTLSCSNCSRLKHFPEIKNDMKNLKNLCLDGTAIDKLPPSIEHLGGLEYLNLERCKNLVSLPKSIFSLMFLKTLSVTGCPKLYKLPEDLNSLKCLEQLFLVSLGCELPCLAGLSSLRTLVLSYSNVRQGIIGSANRLSLLTQLYLDNCNLMEGEIPNDIFHLSSLESLHLSGTRIRFIPSDINKLSKLKFLGLSHCKELQGIMELPSSLRILDAHDCTFLKRVSSSLSLPWQRQLWHSLFYCFRSEIEDLECRDSRPEIQFSLCYYLGQGISVVIPEKPEWIRYQTVESEIKIELPMNWYEDIDFLGFALWAVYPPPKDGNFDFSCYLSICGDQSEYLDDLKLMFQCAQWCNESDPVWMIYYPQRAIKKMKRSNLWRQFKALFFSGSLCDANILPAKECGIHLIYAQDHHQKHPLVIHNRDLEAWVENRFTKNVHGTCLQCRKNKKFVDILCLESTAINEISTIECFPRLETLCLRNCKNLESLPSSIYKLKSLVILSCSGCSNLKSFPEILENMPNLRELHLNETAIKELPSSIEHLQGLRRLDVAACHELVIIPESICNLSSLILLDINFCSKLEKFPKNLGSLQCLQYLGAAGLELISSQSPSFPGLELTISMNAFSSIPAIISQLSKLRVLKLCHYHKLLQIPELPSSIRTLDVHSCRCLETLSSPSSLLGFSLLKCFKSLIQEFGCSSNRRKGIDIVLPGNNGIPEWIGHRIKGSQITIELPMNWYQKHNFLGLALYSLYFPHDNAYVDGDIWTSKCRLEFHDDEIVWEGNLQLKCCYECRQNGRESYRLWVAYYPKVAIPNEYYSNEWRHLRASFHNYFGCKQAIVEECGFHLLYSQEEAIEEANFHAKRSCESTSGTKHNHQPMVQ